MTAPELLPHWMRDVERLAAYKTQLYLYGNIKDTVLFPVGGERESWTLGPMRQALFELFRHRIPGYEVVAAYNLVDGMVFADGRDANTMARLYEEILNEGEKAMHSAYKGRVPQPTNPESPLEQALQQMRLSLVNRSRPCVFIIENATQLATSPASLNTGERMCFLRLLKASGESQLVSSGEGESRRVLQNLLVLLCDKLTDLPVWLYLNNPFTGGIEVDVPRGAERKHFFDLFLKPGKKAQVGARLEPADLVELTEGMTVRDLCGIRALARRPESTAMTAKSLVDFYKYGVQESEWDRLDWKRLDTAEAELAKRVIGQPAAVSAVADMLRRARLNLSGAQHASRTKPRGVLFFAGPTGVGKTELAKAIAELVFRTDEACIRFDMSEYSQSHADQRLLGAPPGYIGYEEGGQLTNQVKANPFRVILFDEVEKAHPSILDKFLQILEDGRMTDGRGDTVYFSESIIIFTSNVGTYKLDPNTGRPMVDPVTRQPVLHVDPEIHIRYEDMRLRMLEGVQAYFKHYLGRPELLNRIGQNIIVFDFIRQPVKQLILERRVLPSISRQVAESWGLEVIFAQEVIDKLMEVGGADVASGGRGIGNLAETAVLNPLSRVLFLLLQEYGDLRRKRLRVSGIIPPKTSGDHRYDITWEMLEDAEAPEEDDEPEDEIVVVKDELEIAVGDAMPGEAAPAPETPDDAAGEADAHVPA
ncbi:MAG TPA: AAA family ATPase [Armatimonadota bacterium]|nr:AAA family ATPase [Armatimonadota bacterium]